MPNFKIQIPKSKCQMSNQVQNLKSKNKYDLVERTAVFGEDIIEFAKELPKNPINNPKWFVQGLA